jgi:hypothetical protein
MKKDSPAPQAFQVSSVFLMKSHAWQRKKKNARTATHRDPADESGIYISLSSDSRILFY